MSWVRSLRLKPGDFVIAAAVILLAAGVSVPFLGFGGAEAVYAEIYEDDVLVKRVLLEEGCRETVTIEGAVTNAIEIEGRSVRFAHSTCPDQVCVRSGALTRAGQAAVCLPNRVVVRLTGGGEPEVDAIVGGASA